VYYDGTTPCTAAVNYQREVLYFSRVPEVGELLDQPQQWYQVTQVGHLPGPAGVPDFAAWISVVPVDKERVSRRARYVPGATYPA
jgi:hypothetical protein